VNDVFKNEEIPHDGYNGFPGGCPTMDEARAFTDEASALRERTEDAIATARAAREAGQSRVVVVPTDPPKD
jgi:hypothetical protein